jgi:hypothetical protein
VRINLQVIDAMGHNGDCQPEHLSRKLARHKKRLSIARRGRFSHCESLLLAEGFSVAKAQNR